MDAGPDFAEVLVAKLTAVPPQPRQSRSAVPVLAPAWVLELGPLQASAIWHPRGYRVVTTSPAEPPAPAVPVVEPTPAPVAVPIAPIRPAARGACVVRNPRERSAIHMLNALGADLHAAATDDEVRSAYRRLVRETHPDRHTLADAVTREGHARRLRAIVAAWRAFEQAHAAAA